MSESGELQCEPCMHENVITSASKWCTDCEESFCEECCRSHKAQKMSRNHHVISSQDYQETKKFNVNLECPEHNKQFDFYCLNHDSIICAVCVQSNHGGCKDFSPLYEVAKGSKTSTAFTDLEQTIDGLLGNIENGVQHLQQNKTNLEEKENGTKKLIATKRAKINKHLDRLEKKLLKEVTSKSEKVLEEISLMTTKLETQHKHISNLKDTAQHMKQFSSNLQMFVGIRSILKNVVNEINGIKLLVNSIPQISIGVQFNPQFDTFTEAFDSLGEIQVTSKQAVVPYVERQLIKAQYQRPPVHNLDNLQLILRTTMKMSEQKTYVTSCLILPNTSIMIVDRNKPFLTILKEDGSHDHDIRVPYKPYYLTLIDDQRVAVSYGSKTCITIVNINNQLKNQTLENVCKDSIWGITYNDGKLYAVVDREGIKVIDLDGNIIKTIRKDAIGTYKVTTQKDKIYFSFNNGSVHCVDMEGTEIWTCRDDRFKSVFYLSPAIAVDNCGITFAAGYENNILIAISPDGKQQKVLLTSSDGLQYPNAVYFDNDSKRLLVCNQKNGHAALYDVIY